MYYCDAGTNKIESANLDGSNRVVQISTGNTDIHPFDLGVYGNNIIWTDWLFNKVVKMSTQVGTNAVLSGPAAFNRASGIHIQYGRYSCEPGALCVYVCGWRDASCEPGALCV